MSRVRIWGLILLVGVLAVSTAEGRVTRVEVDRRVELLGGKSFGPHGAYELIEGRIYFAFDPGNAANERIVDLGRAPRDSTGEVRAWANFTVLQPVDPSKRRGQAVVEVSNRGGKFTLPYFNYASASLDPSDPDFFGSVVPLPATPSEKRATGDPRPAVTTLYPDKQAYMFSGPRRRGRNGRRGFSPSGRP